MTLWTALNVPRVSSRLPEATHGRLLVLAAYVPHDAGERPESPVATQHRARRTRVAAPPEHSPPNAAALLGVSGNRGRRVSA